jgi:NAD+ diphosphatase
MAVTAFSNIFAGNPLDRASGRRGDATWISDQIAAPGALGVALWNGRLFVEPDGESGRRLAYLPAPLAAGLAGGAERLLFLGLWNDTAVFAVDLEGPADPASGPLAGMGQFEELRPLALLLPEPEAAIAATARQMFEWRRRHRFCSSCGHPSDVIDAGWKRVCHACQAEHFPRTDPVVIMLPFHGERCLLGRQEQWPPGLFSALAGFLEPGESIEEACARELAEEAGLRARAVRYHSTQPWPFPSSLMIGLIAEVEDDEGAPDQTELSEIRWFTRAEARDLLAGRIEGAFAPQRHAIAHQLIRAWAEQDIIPGP